MFYCEYCKYKTHDKSNYQKHLNTNKHAQSLGNVVIIKQITGEVIQAEDETEKNKIDISREEFVCEHCKKSYTKKRYLYKHQKYHCKDKQNKASDEMKGNLNKLKEEIMTGIREELIEKLDEKDKIINDQNKRVEKILIEGTKQMKNNNKKIYDMSMKNQSSYKFILEHFDDAPDVFFPKDIEEQLYLNMEKYMNMDNPVMAISKAFLDFIPKQPQEKRFIHGIDISRVKYVVKKNGKWNVDYYAKEVIPKFVKHFKKSCGRFVNTELKVIKEPRIYDRIAFLDKLDSKILSNKVARNVSHDLQLNKTHFLERMIEMQK